MNPYANPKETQVGDKRPKIQHIAPDAQKPRTRQERQAEKEAVTATRRAIKKSARQHLKRELLAELDEQN